MAGWQLQAPDSLEGESLLPQHGNDRGPQRLDLIKLPVTVWSAAESTPDTGMKQALFTPPLEFTRGDMQPPAEFR